ncbi:MAG: class I SAM-dependent methyltransferase [Bacteroidia bacterium]
MKENDELPFCILCNSVNIQKKFVKDGIAYYHCNSCGFLFSKPSINVNFQENIGDFDDAYIKYFDTNVTDRKNFDSLLKWIYKEIDLSGKSILDIGCGSGKFVNYLRERGLNCKGLEYSKPLFEKYLKGKEYFINNSIEGFIETDGSHYDVITLFDVLEHVERPVKFIESISKLQPGGGYFIIEIPLYGTLPSLLLGKKWHFFHKYHFSYFRKKQLIKLLREHGYNLVQSKYRGKYFHLSYLLKYFFYNYLKRDNLNVPEFMESLYININIHDIFIACFKKNVNEAERYQF